MFVLYYLRDLCQLILAPLKGWEDIAADCFDPRRLLTHGLLPFLAFTALTVWVRAFYVVEVSVAAFIEQMIVCFIKYFATYFCALFFFTLYLPVCIEGELSISRCHTFIAYGVGLLALIDVLQNCIPVELSLVYVMPVYAVYIMWRALRYLGISFGGVGKFLMLIIFTIVMPPYLLQYLFNLIIPQT